MNQPERPRVVSVADGYIASPAFTALFRRGMDLVEETSVYLDGPGRIEVKQLDRRLAIVYATEGMRLSTRLMKAASWLLLIRSKKEDDISDRIFRIGKARIALEAEGKRTEDLNGMPEKFLDLVTRSHALMDDIRRLDTHFR